MESICLLLCAVGADSQSLRDLRIVQVRLPRLLRQGLLVSSTSELRLAVALVDWIYAIVHARSQRSPLIAAVAISWHLQLLRHFRRLQVEEQVTVGIVVVLPVVQALRSIRVLLAEVQGLILVALHVIRHVETVGYIVVLHLVPFLIVEIVDLLLGWHHGDAACLPLPRRHANRWCGRLVLWDGIVVAAGGPVAPIVLRLRILFGGRCLLRREQVLPPLLLFFELLLALPR
mmetsp:Transcript_67708/g.162523  ORF Transcript_67708/g.162523 Transcript_67708/m.162523 type:complete len:231 (-) Transcript_67708:2210-2902(-)